MKQLLLLLGICLSGTGTLLVSQPIRGVVTDTDTGLPVEQATVSILNSFVKTSTDSNGTFVLSPLPAGKYVVEVSAYGFASEQREIRLEKGIEHLMSIPLKSGSEFESSEVIISAQRSPQQVWEVSEVVRIMTASELQRIRPRSTPEALMDLPGVWMQKTNHGGGSAFVRGFTGNQTLLLIDGIRMNNATYRYGPNQYLNTVDPWYLDRVEVVQGSGSVSYGSDALGGVIQLFSPEPKLQADGGFHTETEVLLKYLSQDMERSARANLQLSTGRLATHIGVSYKNFGDLLAGGNLGLQAPSAYTEINGDFKSIYQVSPRKRLTLAWQRVQQAGVGRYDQVAQRGYARYEFDPQERQLAYLRWESKGRQPAQATWRATISAQQSIEGRIKQRMGNAFETQEKDVVRTLGLNLEQVITPVEHWHISSGLETYVDRIGSEAFQLDLGDSTRLQLRGLYPDGSSAWNVAAYSLHRWKLKTWRIEAGLRYNWFRLQAEDEQFGDWILQPQSLVGQGSIRRDWSPWHHTKFSLQNGFCAPNINDLSSFGPFDSGIEVPAASLQPEKSWTLELSERFRSSTWQAEWTLFATRLTQLIARVPAQYQGQDSLDGQAVFTKANLDAALLTGAETQMSWQVHPHWRVQTSLTYTFGQTLEEEPVPLRRIPPLFGQTAMLWQSEGWEAQLMTRYAAAQRRLSPGDLRDHRIADGGTDGWLCLDLRLGYVGDWWEVRLGAQNLLNQAYRYHGSGVDAYGRSGWVSVAVRL